MDLVSQNLLLTSGGKKDSTYVDDVFSTYLWWGNETARTIPTGVDNTEGALAWVKSRNDTHQHHLVDTERGSNKVIYSDSHIAESTIANRITGFTNNGFNVGSAGQVNGTNAYKYAGWNFRKQKGFFDIVTWTGNATNSSSPPRQIAHNLGSVPGAIWVKCLTANQSWACYHKSLGATKYLGLNGTSAATTSSAYWGDTDPTSTHFTVKHDGQVNETGHEYVAYIFAGGESNAATAPSVDFDGSSSEYLSLANTSDLKPGSGDFTIEMWVKPDATADSYDFVWSYGWEQQISWYHQFASGQFGHTYFRAWFRETEGGSYVVDLNSTNKTCAPRGAWSHVAVVRNGSLFTLYVNGNAEATATHTGAIFGTTSDLPMIGQFGGTGGSSYPFKGKISNFRFTKGQALYTSNFRPSTEPLTTTSQGAIASNVKLLCCNNSSVTGSTVTPGTITANNSPTASTDSPFDDPEGFKFGEEGDQNIVKTGSYVGNGNNDGPEVYLGWEPQWVLIKNASTAKSWKLLDSMRGIVTGDMEAEMQADQSNAEHTGAQRIDLTSTGFKVKTTSPIYNGDGDTYIYICIRRSDGYCGKPPELGTDVFNMVMGTSNSDIPAFVSGFVTDFALYRKPAATYNWWAQNRLSGGKIRKTNDTDAETDNSSETVWDSNSGWAKGSGLDSTIQSWMWKRHKGMDVVAYDSKSQAENTQIAHSMSVAPEMIFIKYRNNTNKWIVGHKGLNGGTNAWAYNLVLNTTDDEEILSSTYTTFSSTAPTSTHFTVGSNWDVNAGSGASYIAMLFASVDGISKVGSYDGTGVSGLTITTGFTPRFLIIKNYTWSHGDWFVYDTTRGWTSGTNSEVLTLNGNGAQTNSGTHNTAPTSTGFSIVSTDTAVNASGQKFIYYAHA